MGELCEQLKREGPSIDTRRELWTRESAEGQKSRAAMRDALSVELDIAADQLESGQDKKSWMVRAVIAMLVLGLLALVLRSLLQAR